MFCKCCKGGSGMCGCMHHKVEKMVLGLVLLVLAVLLYMHNYGMLGAKLLCGPSVDMWSWLIPLLVGLVGLKLLVLGCMHMMYAKKHGKECNCEDGKCSCKTGDDKCCSDKDGMDGGKCCDEKDEVKKD